MRQQHRYVNMDVQYNDQILDVSIVFYMYGKLSKSYIRFRYKKVDVFELFDSKEENYQQAVKTICELIDQVGVEKYRKFDRVMSELKRIYSRRIIVDNKVYANFYESELSVGDRYMYSREISMTDGNQLEDHLLIDDREDVESKQQVLRNLRRKVKNYFEEVEVLPHPQYLNTKYSLVYQDITEWMEQNIPTYYIHRFMNALESV